MLRDRLCETADMNWDDRPPIIYLRGVQGTDQDRAEDTSTWRMVTCELV